MLVQLIPDQVSARWSLFKPLIRKSLPPTAGYNEKAMSNILANILLENLDVWLYEEDGKGYFIVVTAVRSDAGTNQRSLLIYAMTGIRTVDKKMWFNAYQTLKGEAEKLNCANIIAYTVEQKIIDFITEEGGRADFTLLELEV